MGTKRQIVELGKELFLAVIQKSPSLVTEKDAVIDPLQQRCLDLASAFFAKARKYGASAQRKGRRIYVRQPGQKGA